MSRTRRPARPQGPDSPRGSVSFRLRAGFIVIAMLLSVLGGRLVQLQGVDPGEYAAMAAAEGTVEVDLPAVRGDILDRNGEPLAQSIEGLMIAADPSLTAEYAPELARFLTQRLEVDYFTILPRLRKQGDGSRFQYIARRVPATLAEDVVAEAEELGYEGLFTRRDPLRTYPGDDVAANLVGFIGTDDAFGGLEGAFDAQLSGTDGRERYQVGAGNRLPLGETTVEPAENGVDITTTIDRDLQWYAQRVLAQAVQKAGGESGHAIVMDTRTGELLTQADYPTYDANDPASSDVSDRRAHSLNLVYEPGSVAKVFTIAGLLDAGYVTPETKLKVPSRLYRQDRSIGDWWQHDELNLTLAGVLAKSSNIGTVLAADNYKPGQLRRYLQAFGLGQRTGIGVPGESRGILPAGAAWTDQTEDRIAFGQSVSVTALQMAAAVNTIANRGLYVTPSLIQGAATRNDGATVGTDTATTRRVISEEAAEQTALMMERVVDPDAGVAPRAQVPGYRVAGKTGTAQRVDDECGCYNGSTTVSFGGFAPADDPRFTVYVAIHDPRKGSGGGSTAGPVFSKLMSYTLHRYGVPPTGTKPSDLPVEW